MVLDPNTSFCLCSQCFHLLNVLTLFSPPGGVGMYVCMVIIYSGLRINRVSKVADPAHGELNRENEYYPVPVVRA